MRPTPGPWAGRFENGHYVVVGKNRVVIRSCRLEDVSVIAAAPEMLEVLEWLLEEFDRRELDGNAVFCLADLAQVRTVIRKARGEA